MENNEIIFELPSGICKEYEEVSYGASAPKGNGRRWMFTIQLGYEEDYGSPEELDDAWHLDIENPDIRYAVYQREQAPKTGSLHIQGYMELTKAIGFRAVQKILNFGKPWVGRCNGKQEQCIAYCTKEETRHSDTYWEHGERHKGGQGTRNDLTWIKEVIEENHANPTGVDARVLVGNEDYNAFLKYHKGIDTWSELTVRPRTTKPKVVWIYGPTGVGKSYWFWSRYPYPTGYPLMIPDKLGEKLWFENYKGQHAILLDDFGGEISFKTMLRLLDQYPLMVQVKGGSTHLRSPVMCITSDKHPLDINWGESYVGDKAQLIRRITDIIYIGPKEEEFDEETITPSPTLAKHLKKVKKERLDPYEDVDEENISTEEKSQN
nr:putative replication associated protein [Crucivirus sp.]